jgi:glutamate-1-semialdehyde aminotransferase
MQTATDLLISITNGGEALSLAAACACMREYRAKPVHDTIHAQGRKLVDGFNAAAARHGVAFAANGPVMMCQYAFEYGDAGLNADCMTLLLQEMAKRGVLLRRGGLLFVTYSHDDDAVAATLAALDQVMADIREAVDAENLKARLEVVDVVESFRRF